MEDFFAFTFKSVHGYLQKTLFHLQLSTRRQPVVRQRRSSSVTHRPVLAPSTPRTPPPSVSTVTPTRQTTLPASPPRAPPAAGGRSLSERQNGPPASVAAPSPQWWQREEPTPTQVAWLLPTPTPPSPTTHSPCTTPSARPLSVSKHRSVTCGAAWRLSRH